MQETRWRALGLGVFDVGLLPAPVHNQPCFVIFIRFSLQCSPFSAPRTIGIVAVYK